jgi:hypothetical protein
MSARDEAVAKFNPNRLQFGRTAARDDNGEGLPRPLTARAAARRVAGIKEAKEVLTHLPGPGESLHAVCTARLDLTDVINALVERLGTCDRMRVATLGYNERNLSAMLGWLDTGAVKQLSLVASIFFRSHKGDLWEETLREFGRRRQRAACCHSHAKVVTLAFAGGERLAIEGSANLCGNGSGREQFALFNDAALHDWHAGWIGDLLDRHEGAEDGGRAEQAEAN